VSAVWRLAVCDAARAHALCRFLLKGERETSRDGARHHFRVDAPRCLRPRGGERQYLPARKAQWYQAERELERPSRVMPTMLGRALEPD
jgi:hypothetical protein